MRIGDDQLDEDSTTDVRDVFDELFEFLAAAHDDVHDVPVPPSGYQREWVVFAPQY